MRPTAMTAEPKNVTGAMLASACFMAKAHSVLQTNTPGGGGIRSRADERSPGAAPPGRVDPPWLERRARSRHRSEPRLRRRPPGRRPPEKDLTDCLDGQRYGGHPTVGALRAANAYAGSGRAAENPSTMLTNHP